MKRLSFVLAVLLLGACAKPKMDRAVVQKLNQDIQSCRLREPVAIVNPNLLSSWSRLGNVEFDTTPETALLPKEGALEALFFQIHNDAGATGFLGVDFFWDQRPSVHPAAFAGAYLGKFDIQGSVTPTATGFEYRTQVLQESEFEAPRFTSLYARTAGDFLEALGVAIPVAQMKTLGGVDFPSFPGPHEVLCVASATME